MYDISALYEQYLQERSRDWLVKVNIAGTDYSSNSIVDFSVENEISGEEEFELGTATLSKLTLHMKTSDVIAANAKVIPYLALTGSSGNTEWLPIGEFYIDRRKQVNNVWTYICYDKLVWADVPYVSQLTYPATMQDVFDEICDSLSYTYDSSVVIDASYMIEVGPAGYSKRQVLAYIAAANAACLYIGKDGTLRFRSFSATDTPVFDMTASDYIKAKKTNPEKSYTRVVVTYDTEDDLTYEAGTGDENHTLYLENPFMTQEMVNDLQAAMNGFSYFPAEIDARGYPQIEAGDRLRFGHAATEYTWETADVAWEDADFTWDGYSDGGITLALNMKYTFAGGLKMSLDAPSKSEQESEFQVDGTLSGQINKLNKNAVRKGRDYFGVTITDDEGLIVEKGDHSSKVTLNSDEQKWEVDGVAKLEYDAITNKLKFTGDITMEGGTISWTDVSAPDYSDIQGTKPPSDADNTTNTIGPDRLTKITSTGVYTGTVGTDQLIAGEALIDSALIESLKVEKLDTSTAKITSAMIETLTVGDNVVMGPTATITWTQVTDKDLDYNNITGTKPPSNADNTYNTIGANRLTEITSTGVYTGTVGTDQLIVGAALIGVALIEDLIVGDNVTMGPSATISWTQVSDRPNTTYIDETGVYTGTVVADQIDGGTITGIEITGSQIVGTIIATSDTSDRIVITSDGVISTTTLFGNWYDVTVRSGPCLLPTNEEMIVYNSGNVGVTVGYDYINAGSGSISAGGTWSFSEIQPDGINLPIGDTGMSYNIEAVGYWDFRNANMLFYEGSWIYSSTFDPDRYIKINLSGTDLVIPAWYA